MTFNAKTQVRKIVVLLVGALVVVGAMAVTGWLGGQRVVRTFHWVDHTHQVIYELEATLTHAISIQSGARGFALTADSKFLEPYDSGLLRVQHSIARLRDLVSDNPTQQKHLERLSSLVGEEASVMQERLAARRTGGLAAASAATADGRGKRVVDAIRRIVEAMQQEERRLLAERSSAAVTASLQILMLVSVATAATYTLILLAIRTVRRVPLALDQH